MNCSDWLIIAELETIIGQIEEKEAKLDFLNESDVALKTAYIETIKLIDAHISKLKGENK